MFWKYKIWWLMKFSRERGGGVKFTRGEIQLGLGDIVDIVQYFLSGCVYWKHNTT